MSVRNYMEQWWHSGESPGGEGGVLRISSDGDDRRIFFFEIFDSGIFLGTKISQVFVWGSLIFRRDFWGY